jgi:hypothetical protein
MILSVLDLHGYGIYAIDGDIGNVDEFYFDDDTWTIRCLVTQTGDWFSDRRVLVSPLSVRWVDWQNRRLAVSLYRYEVRNSPDIDVAKPISRQHEIEFNRYYGWTNYWTGPGLWGGGIIPGDLWARLKPESPGLETKENPAGVAEEKDTRDTHLRSTKEVIGYHIHATDGETSSSTINPGKYTSWSWILPPGGLARK